MVTFDWLLLKRFDDTVSGPLKTALGALEVHLANEHSALSQHKARLQILDEMAIAAVASADVGTDDDESGSSDGEQEQQGIVRPPKQSIVEVVNGMEDAGEVETAAQLCFHIVRHRRSAHGDHHPRTQAALRKLASLTLDSGDAAGAEPLYLELLDEMIHQLGARHPRTLSAMVDLAMAQREVGKLEEVEGTLREALYWMLEVNGKRHRDTLGAIGNLADVLREQGRFSDATAMFGDALEVASEVLGQTHMTTLVLGAKAARLRTESAQSAARAEDTRQAAAQLETIVAVMQHALGDGHPQVRKYQGVLRLLTGRSPVSRHDDS